MSADNVHYLIEWPISGRDTVAFRSDLSARALPSRTRENTRVGLAGPKERIVFDSPIGDYLGPRGVPMPFNVATIRD